MVKMPRVVKAAGTLSPRFPEYKPADCHTNFIYPVILPVPIDGRQLKGRDRSIFLSRCARTAVKLSARKRGGPVVKFEKDDNGAPLSERGQFWSLSHKPEFVAGVAAPTVTGIDIEKIRCCSPGLRRKIANEDEWRLAESLFDDSDEHVFALRYWTAKEAVLKAAGVGLRGLSRCRILGIPDVNHLLVSYQGGQWMIEHFFFSDHIVSVVKNSNTVIWSVPVENEK